MTVPPITPPIAFATLKKMVLVAAACTGATAPYFMTRACIGGTLAKDTVPNKNAEATKAHRFDATKANTTSEAIVAMSHSMRERLQSALEYTRH